VLTGSAEAQVISGGIVKHLLIAYFIGNICAKKYQNPFMCVKVIASQRWDIFWDTVSTVYMRSSISNKMHIYDSEWRSFNSDNSESSLLKLFCVVLGSIRVNTVHSWRTAALCVLKRMQHIACDLATDRTRCRQPTACAVSRSRGRKAAVTARKMRAILLGDL